MGKADEDSIRNAIQTVKSGVSVNKAATRWGVPRTTLMNRLKGKGSHQTGSEVLQRLSRQQEINLCGWAITETAAGNPPTQRKLCDMATKILVAKGDLRPLGRNWIDAFFRRNPELKLGQGKSFLEFLAVNLLVLTIASSGVGCRDQGSVAQCCPINGSISKWPVSASSEAKR